MPAYAKPPTLSTAELADLITEAKKALAKMTPEQREAMRQAQRESWARQDMD